MSDRALDLDGIETAARAAAESNPDEWEIYVGEMDTSGVTSGLDRGGWTNWVLDHHSVEPVIAKFIVAVQPSVALAMVARIRELDAKLGADGGAHGLRRSDRHVARRMGVLRRVRRASREHRA